MKSALFCACFLALSGAGVAQRLPKDLGPAEYYRPPQLTLMIGFIKDPQH